ncbi:MAG TPA: cyclic nucleotide-binding domain-containing protein [Gammaproteobacteria bacterium]|nr:cyclic nucleotide-binding domain-containing protein [Gammaproteobacteria bacterium]
MSESNQLNSVIQLISRPEWQIVRHLFKEMVRPAKTVLIQQGVPSSGLIILRSGALEVTKKIPGGDSLTIGVVQEGGHIGEVSLIDDQPSMVNVISLTPVHFIYLDRSYYKALCTAFPEKNYHLMHILILKALNKNKQYIENIVSLLKRTPSLGVNYQSYELAKSKLQQGYYYDHSDKITLNELQPFMHFTEDEGMILKSYAKPVYILGESYFDVSQQDSIFMLLEGAVQLKHVDEGIMLTFDTMTAGHIFAAERMIKLPLVSSCLHVREYAGFLSFDQGALERLKKEHIHLYGKLFQVVSYSIIARLRNISIHLIRIGSEGMGDTNFYIDF